MTEPILESIAIIAMHGRFPGAGSVEEFWDNLVAGRESISFFNDAELASAGLDPAALRRAGHYVPARGILKDAEFFDAAFFGVHPKEAEVMDPQHRVFLEACWEALERAGYAPGRLQGAVGLYAGATFNTYYLHALHPRPELRELVGSEQVMLGNEKDYLATRVAYKLDLKGPAISLDTACSSSLVAVCQACQALLTYQCDIALAGGVSVRVPQQRGYFYQEGNIASPDGHTRTFDAAAQGTAFSNGVTLVVLKRLSEAINDRDQVFAVIKGTAINNDGSQRVSFGAPGVEGQSEVVSLAQEIAGVSPESVSYVEAHGTGTPIGDPIEVVALTKAFRRGTQRKQFCALGSVKSNVGHLDAAAGTAGLIKTALALKHHLLPPSLHFQRANPKLDLDNSPFFVNAALREWKSETDAPLIAGVSSFGTGGTNAHVIIEEAPPSEPGDPSRPWQMLLLSAKTAEALEVATRNLAVHLKARPEANLADVAYTLQVGRSEFAYRRVVVCQTLAEAVALLEKPDGRKVFTARQELKAPPVVFMFPGQGAQYVNMGAEVYREEKVFRETLDQCAEILQPLLGLDLREALFAPAGTEETANEQLRQTLLTQPALFTIEYALARLWMSWGVKPAAMIGHSVGEYVAGCLAGVFSLETALAMVARRAELVQAQPPGSMLAVRLPETEIQPLLGDGLAIAAINSPKLCVVSGMHEAIARLEKQLSKMGVAAKHLHTSHAFHSSMMDPVLAPFTELLRKVKLREPQIPYVSNVTARWITGGEATSPEYWAAHVRQTVRFAEGVAEFMKDSRHVLLEIGPGQTLSQLARQHPARKEEQPVIATLGAARDQELPGLLGALGRLWLAGAAVDWPGYYRDERRRRVVLPTYPFERKRYWPESLPTPPRQATPTPAPTSPDTCDAVIDLASTMVTHSVGTLKDAPDGSSLSTHTAVTASAPRKERLINEVRSLVQEISGTTLEGTDPTTNFLELGLDSLLLTQVAILLRQKFGVPVSFRQLMEELSSVDAVVFYLDGTLPPDPEWQPIPIQRVAAASSSAVYPTQTAAVGTPTGSSTTAPPVGSLADLLIQQINLSTQLLSFVQQGGQGTMPVVRLPSPTASCAPSTASNGAPPATEPKEFGPFRGLEARASARSLSDEQQRFLDGLVLRYTARTGRSKEQAQRYRRVLADPRTVAGFRPFWKELVYPIVMERSLGSRMWDVDGNEYVDYSMGFGTNLLGHSPEFVTAAISDQLRKGIEVGPQTPLAGKVAQLMCEITGLERCAFANTGSEAVLATIRVARTVTGRKRIVYFTGDYHGIFDEVLQRAVGSGATAKLLPVAPGIPAQSMEHVTILDYDRPESLETIRALGPEIAAVIVEPVQSRHPDQQPREFLHALRKLTQEIGSALIFDEVITGFRVHPGGVQGLYGIRADLASYGKLIGGGMPIGAICGSARFMDALDGGFWSYGDGSIPEVGVTFFAGTYVRHPLAMAGALATLQQLKKEGPGLQQRLNERMGRAVATLNKFLRDVNAPLHLEHFSSYFWIRFAPEVKFGSLLFILLREKGIFIFEGRLFFLSTAHSEAEVERLIDAFKSSVLEMQKNGFLSGARPEIATMVPVKAASVSLVSAPPAASPASQSALREETDRLATASAAARTARRSLDFSLYFFGNYPAAFTADKYRLILEGAKFADQHGFTAVWLPERHFHAVGGFSPNPSVIAAALARETRRIQLRGGSVVLPLHHPIRVAEEWAMVDNLSRGRVGISISSGWHPNDFVFAPEAYEKRRELCTERLETIRRLWRGEELTVQCGLGNALNVRLHPMPMQSELPVWLTCVQAASFVKAGELGTGVLAMLTNQTVDEVAGKIALYREAFAKHGHDPAKAHVTLLIHTFVGPDAAQARATARQPMCDYLRSYLDNTQKRMESRHGSLEVDQADLDYLLERSFNDYADGKAFIGTPESCSAVASKLQSIGVDEVGCFIDFGIETEAVLRSLPHLFQLKQRCGGIMEKETQMANSTREPAPEAVPGHAFPPAPPAPAAPPERGDNSLEHKLPLTDAQEGLWIISQMSREASRAYIEITTLSLTGPLNLPAMRQALQGVLDRHEGLRTTIDIDGQHQTVHPRMVLDFSLVDISELGDEARPQKLDECFGAFERYEFDLSTGPMFRALLVRLHPEHHMLVLMFHHIFGNGPSFRVVWEDLWALYSAAVEGTAAVLKPAMQLSDFVQWQRQQSTGSQAEADEAFWLNQFSGTVPALELPTDRPRPPVKTYAGASQVLRLGRELTTAVRKAGAAHRGSLFMTLLSAFQALLHRLTGQNDLVVGAAFEPEIRNSPGGGGLYANTTNVLPLRSEFAPETKFVDVLAHNRTLVLSAQEHQHYFFGRLMRKLTLPRDAARSPLFSAFFNYESGKFEKVVQGLKFELAMTGCPFGVPRDTAMFDLYLNVGERDGELILKVDYNSDLLDPATVQRWLGHFRTLLEGIVVSPNETIDGLNLLTVAERRLLTEEWNRTEQPYPNDRTVHQLFDDQARKTPQAIAVEYNGQRLTYAELKERADQVAVVLRSLGVGKDVMVGLCLERSLEMVVAVMGTLKSGGAYVPLDPAFPRERLAVMVEDSQMSVILTQRNLLQLLPHIEAQKICLDEPLPATPIDGGAAAPPLAVAQDDLAYVLFTSGSTGRPKGVRIPHRAFVNFLCSMRREPGLSAEDVLLAVTTLSFDIAGLELFLPLITGAKVVIAPRDVTIDGPRLAELIEKSGATVMQATPATWRMLIEAGWLGNKRLKILCGGESIDTELAARLLEHCGELWNMYGPTETTIWSTTERLFRDQPITVGRPIANTQAYILDGGLKPVPVGVVGEIYIGGTGVAQGYLNRPDLTSERFISNPFDPSGTGRLYRTGDLARFRPDGRIEVIGRADQQVKIRGFRIELGEIEAALAPLNGVAQAVVVAREDGPGDKRLVAYVVPKPSTATLPRDISEGDDSAARVRGGTDYHEENTNVPTLNVSLLRAALRQVLPEYMVPATFVFLEALPLTPNGKVDHKALANYAPRELAGEELHESPRGVTEERLAGIFSTLLSIRSVGRKDDFFDLGGHSILAVRLFNEIDRVFGQRLPLATLFHAPTVERLASMLVRGGNQPQEWVSLVAIQPHGSKPRFFCVHGAGGNILLYRDLARYFGTDYPFYGLQACGLDGKSPFLTTVEEMAEKYLGEIYEIQREGPFCIGGYCLGGTIAFEIAQRLRRDGHEVALLALLDTYNFSRMKEPKPLRLVGQKVKFHLSNLTHMRFTDWPAYFSHKLQVARDGEFSSLWKTLGGSIRKGGGGRGQPSVEASLLELNDWAASAYRPKPYAGRLTVFKPRVNYDFLPDPNLGWSGVVTGGLDIVELPVSPHGMLVEPYVQRLAAEILQRLDEAHDRGKNRLGTQVLA